MRLYTANNLTEAVAMALRFKRERRYDWFRGQTKCRPLTPSADRLTAVEKRKAKGQLRRFYFWVCKTPGLENLKSDITACLAIAQHHGLSTPFLDFSADPSVAGYFAATVKGRVLGKSYIYCMNTADLRKFWDWLREILPHYPDIHLHEINVPNLWRMEAQQGRFLECMKNWDRIYDLDRIEFPASRPLPQPTEDEIYPNRKSHLEVLLDHQFAVGLLRDMVKAIRTAFPQVQNVCLPTTKGGFFPEYFGDGRLPELRSWNQRALQPWLNVTAEPYHQTVRGTISLTLDDRKGIAETRANIAKALLLALGRNPSLRSQATIWQAKPGPMPAKLAEALTALWNGLRRHPWTDEQLADAIALCVVLYQSGFGKAKDSDARKEAAYHVLGENLEVEMSSHEGDPVRAVISTGTLLGAVRPDMKKRLRREYHHCLTHPLPMLQFCANPRRLFDFDRFADVFVREIAPSQVLHRHNRTHIYSVGRVVGFGLP